MTNPVEKITRDMAEKVSQDMGLTLAMLAGCEMTYEITQDEDGLKYVIGTRYPISIEECPGNIVVREQRPKGEKLTALKITEAWKTPRV